MKKYTSVLVMTCGMLLLSSAAGAIEEVIVTGTPPPPSSFDVPSIGQSAAYTGFVSGAFMGGYKDAAIAAAKKQCLTELAAAQKKACDDKKELVFKT